MRCLKYYFIINNNNIMMIIINKIIVIIIPITIMVIMMMMIFYGWKQFIFSSLMSPLLHTLTLCCFAQADPFLSWVSGIWWCEAWPKSRGEKWGHLKRTKESTAYLV